MEDVFTAKLLAFLDITQADAALVGCCIFLCGSGHILQLLELDDELAPLDEG